jgi:putative transposase
MNAYTHGRHAVYAIKYHLVWIPKRRKPVLAGEIAARLRAICEEVAAEHGWTILELVIQPNHVHLFIEATVREAPYQVVQAFKSRSSRLLREEFPELLKLPSLWTRAYFAATVGHVSQETIAGYIEEETGED